MEFYRCENTDCGFLAEEEPDVCPHCGGTFFQKLDEDELTAGDWVSLGNQAVEAQRNTDALASYQRAAAMGDALGLTNLGWCFDSPLCKPLSAGPPVPVFSASAAHAGPRCGCPPGIPRSIPAQRSGPGKAPHSCFAQTAPGGQIP